MKTQLIFIAVFLTLSFILGYISVGEKIVYQEKLVQAPPEVIMLSDSNTTSAVLMVPAVDPDERGVEVRIKVQARPGSGEILTNIDKILFWVDTQSSIRTARLVTGNVTGLDMDSYDLIYTITANASVIEGPSAGAAMAIVTIAAVQNKTIRENVMITGTIDKNGTIGPAGGLLEKVRAAGEVGTELFIIPEGSVGSNGSVQTKNCTVMNESEFCRIDYVPKKVDIAGETGILIKEVKTIEEALQYFI